LALAAVHAALPSRARAEEGDFGIAPGGFAVRLLDAEGNPESRAGAHPDRLQVNLAFEGEEAPEELNLELPPGFSGNPSAVPECPRQAHEEGEECPPETQVGSFKLGPLGGAGQTLPIYSLEPEPGEIAAFASSEGVALHSSLELRPGDFGATMSISDLPEFTLGEAHFELWGVPADHQEGTPAERRPFLTAPSTCGPLEFTLRARGRGVEAPWLSASSETSPPQSGCENLAFEPHLRLGLTNPVADSPTGVDVLLEGSEEEDPGGRGGAQIRDVTIELPAGLTVAPGGATGLTACSDAQLDLDGPGEATCPASSRLGSIEVESPSFGALLSGSVYLGEERPGERLRLFVAVPGPGFVLKFAGAMQPDPATGRLEATLRDLPQATIGRLEIRLGGGPASPFATPLACGPAPAAATFVPYGGGAAVESAASVLVGAGLPGLRCPGPLPFEPQLSLARSSSRAARPISLTATLRRGDGQLLPRRFAFTLPSGLSAALGSMRPCSSAEVAAMACPGDSRIGGVVAEAGPGRATATLTGDLYLTGPYRGAPFGILIDIPARLGPFDLGAVAFRAALSLDERSGRVTIVSDPLPEAVEGVQLRLREIELRLDRAGFLRNPTGCRTIGAAGSVEATSGASVPISAALDPTVGCRKLPFGPRFRLALEGVRGSPGVAVRIGVRMRRREAAMRAMRIALPHAIRLDLAGLGAICSRPDARRGLCPDAARIGTARAWTPLLAKPLVGAAYVVQPEGDGQPDIWLSLSQEGLHLGLSGHTEVDHGRFVTELTGLPDMPLSRLAMRLGKAGGGPLSLPADTCRQGGLASTIFLAGQNGARRRLRAPLGTGARCRARHRRPPAGDESTRFDPDGGRR
jgi:hypothetical protein